MSLVEDGALRAFATSGSDKSRDTSVIKEIWKSSAYCKTKDNKRTLAAEILVNNTARASLIREAKSSQVYSQLQVGAKYGMQTLEQALSKNVFQGSITKEEAFYKCNRPNVLQGLLDNQDEENLD